MHIKLFTKLTKIVQPLSIKKINDLEQYRDSFY